MSKRILLLDDSATARALFKMRISAFPGYEVIEAKTVEEVLKKAFETNPDLIVLDYNMPEKTGTEVAELLQSQGLSTKFVLVTANTQQHILDEANRLGFISTIEKPVTEEAIRELLEKLHELNTRR